MKITFLEEADSEFSAAVAYYDSQEAGLGQPFEDEIASPRLPIKARYLSPNEPAHLSILYSVCYS